MSTFLPALRTSRRKSPTLRDQAAAALRAGDPIAVLPLAVIASYEPLYAIAGFEALPARSWPIGFDDLLTQQVREPLAERALRNDIPRRTPIER